MSALLRSGKFLRVVTGLGRPGGGGAPPLVQETGSMPIVPMSSAYFSPYVHGFRTQSWVSPTIPLPEEDEVKANDFIPVIQYVNMETGTLQIQPLESACEQLLAEGRLWDLENLCYVSSNYASPSDRETIYIYTLKAYLSHQLPNRAIDLSNYLLKRGFDFPAFRSLFNESFTTPPPPCNRSKRRPREDPLRHFKKLIISSDSLDEALEAFHVLESKTKFPSVTEASTLIENLVKAERTDDAAVIAEKMLSRKTYPLPKIFRFLLNKLAISGSIHAMVSIGQRLSSKVKKEVSFDNRLCNAYLAAGKGEVFLDCLQKELDCATEETMESVRDKFPRGGAMGLLESEPALLVKYKKLAEGYVKTGYVAPMNVLWTYFFITGNYSEAQSIWDEYLAPSSQIMFQKVCQTARSKNDVDLATKLVELLHNAKVSPRAQGIAYSCLLDVYSQKGDFQKGFDTFNSCLDSGVKLEDINRTALLRLKSGLVKAGIKCSISIPKKSASNNHEEDEDSYAGEESS
uniref:PROP1-like PPR domain-containing protein n=1 Tax=Lepeophtheirus salmonis TaxID=72036 RepID=A0A0K2V6Y4_LEPSM